MRTDRLLVILTVIVLAAAAAVFFSKRLSPQPEPRPVAAEPGSLSLLVVGIEGMDLSIADKLMAEGKMPNLASLVEKGTTAEFPTLGKSVDRRIVWTSLVTGVAPERQGIGGTMVTRRGDVVKAQLTPAFRTVGTLWTALSDSGTPVGVLGWWGTWPVEHLNGVVVAPYHTYVLERAHGGQLDRQVDPPEMADVVDHVMLDPRTCTRSELARFVDPDSKLGLEALIGKGYEDLSMAYAGDRSMLDAARVATAGAHVKAVLVLLPGTELASQRFWHTVHLDELDWGSLTEDTAELVREQNEALHGVIDLYYEAVDGILGDLLRLAASDANVAVVSDHGYDRLRYGKDGRPLVDYNLYDETGFWVMAGPRVKAGLRLEDSELLDFAPTVAAAAGVELGDAVEGEVLHEVFAE